MTTDDHIQRLEALDPLSFGITHSTTTWDGVALFVFSDPDGSYSAGVASPVPRHTSHVTLA